MLAPDARSASPLIGSWGEGRGSGGKIERVFLFGGETDASISMKIEKRENRARSACRNCLAARKRKGRGKGCPHSMPHSVRRPDLRTC